MIAVIAPLGKRRRRWRGRSEIERLAARIRSVLVGSLVTAGCVHHAGGEDIEQAPHFKSLLWQPPGERGRKSAAATRAASPLGLANAPTPA
jgi:hypothetical protein